jgi:outer membrane receptor for ferrienterochelin and colicins
MINQVRFILYLIVLASVSELSYAQVDSLDIYDYNFNQLSRLKVTSAAKVSQRIGELPSTIYIISSSEIREKGYFTLDEVLSDLPGFQFRNILGFNSYIFQRGVPNQNNLILLLIDGVQVNELNSGGFYGGGQYNLSNVERIEVVYGPASVAYGTNAVTGIINIITKNATENQIEAASLIGSFNTVSCEASYCRSNEKKNIGVRISGMYKQSDKADLRGTAGDNNWTDLMENYENDYSLDLKIKAGNFYMGTNFLQKQASTTTIVKSTGTLYKDYGTLWNIRFVNNYLKFDKILSEHFILNSSMYNRNATVLDNTIYYVLDTAQVGYYRPNNLTGCEAIVSYNSDKIFSCIGGIMAEYEQLAKNYSITYSDSSGQRPSAPQKPPMLKNNLISIFVRPQLTLFNNLFLSGGIRFDQSSIYDQVFTPRAGLNYHFRDHIFRFSYAEAFRAPKPWDYYDGLGNTSLLPEKMLSLESSVSLSFTENIYMDLNGYKNKLENAIIKELNEEGYRWVNEGVVNTDGFEIYFRYTSQKFKSALNYTFNNSYNENHEPIPEISKHCANVSITYSIYRHLKVNLRANYYGKRENPKVITTTNNYTINPCFVVNGTLYFFEIKGFTMQFIVKNLLNKEYYHPSNRIPDRYRQPQRTIMFSVGYSIDN